MNISPPKSRNRPESLVGRVSRASHQRPQGPRFEGIKLLHALRQVVKHLHSFELNLKQTRMKS